MVGTGGCALVVLDLDALEHAGVVVGFVRGFAASWVVLVVGLAVAFASL